MKFVNSMLYMVFILLLLGVAGLFLASLLPIPGNVQVKIVKSGSMEPAIRTGGIVVVKPSATYQVGDVITFGADTGTQIPTTHRIVSVDGDFSHTFYMTKGDANEEEDNVRVAQNDVVGKVVFSLPYAGYVLDFARQPIGFTLMIGIPAGIIILDEMARIWREVRGMRITGIQKKQKSKKEDEEPEEEGVSMMSDIEAQFNYFDFNLSNMRVRSMDGIRPRGRSFL